MEYQVGMGEFKIGTHPDLLSSRGLGSCVGVALYNLDRKRGGLLHVMLPDSASAKQTSNLGKFADTGIDLLVKELRLNGIKKEEVTAKIAGGADMFPNLQTSHQKRMINIGEKNAQAVKEKLKELGIRIAAEDLGGNKGRTVTINLETGAYEIRTVGVGGEKKVI